MLTINEIFHSIQGESTRAGLPCVFVRLTACDLRCAWCDTPYAFTEGQKLSTDEVVRQVEGYGCPLVEITGGEPLLQEEVYPLMERLMAAGNTVLLETGGHISVARVPSGVVKLLDVPRHAGGGWTGVRLATPLAQRNAGRGVERMAYWHDGLLSASRDKLVTIPAAPEVG